MHMADALLTPAVAGVMYAASAVVAGASIVELHKEEKQDLTSAAKKLPTMAVMSALVFAGQMINYTIPGTGSSGHLCGGLLLTSVLGPWAGFLSMIVILTIQCLFFADGGLLALGANVWNMAFYSCFVGYFLIYRPLMRSRRFADFARQMRRLYPGCLPLTAGSCTLCARCTYPDRPCRYPTKRLSSMEAYGLFVSDICARSGLAYNYGPRTMTYTSCVLYNKE